MRRVFRFLTTPLDRLALWSAHSGQADRGGCSHAAEAQQLLEGADFFCSGLAVPAEARFTSERDFCFHSPLATPWAENNIVPGKLHRAGKAWREKPAVILLHGWNGELGYRWQFPLLAWRLARRGVNAAMIELPYHGRRKPRGPGVICNFISHDLLTVAAVCDRLAILHAGEIVECGPLREVLSAPKHAYSKRLIAAVGSLRSRGEGPGAGGQG